MRRFRLSAALLLAFVLLAAACGDDSGGGDDVLEATEEDAEAAGVPDAQVGDPATFSKVTV